MWTEDQARALIADAGTLKRGLDLAAPSKWSNLGRTTDAAWGECAGSGSKPYLVGIDLTEPAFKCSCPSRLFPCKHGAGLLLLIARQEQLFGNLRIPAWLAEWVEKRRRTSTKPATKAVEPTAASEITADTVGAPENAFSSAPVPGVGVAPQRLERMQRGATELLGWLHDLMAAGLAQTEKVPVAFWENQAARLVDDQLPGLAAGLRELSALRHTGPDWPERLLARLGELYLLTRAFLRLEQVPPALRPDVLQLVGINLKKDDILNQHPAVSDTWLVVGQSTTEEDRLLARRTWLWGCRSGRYALVLEYAYGGQLFPTPLVPAGRYAGSLTYYPGAVPLRALTSADWQFIGVDAQASALAVAPDALFDQYAEALGRQPWLREWPVTLHGVVPTLLASGAVALLHTATDLQFPVRAPADSGWLLLAASGGHPVTLFGEWNGRALLPLAHWSTPNLALKPSRS